MASTGPSLWPDLIPIAQLQPSTDTRAKSITGVVTLIWPYSASPDSFSLLLVEPDFRLRRNKGQVRLHFAASCAKLVVRAGIKSGDQVLLSLQGVQWTKEASTESISQTPGRGIDWELRFEERVVLQIHREDQEPIEIDIDNPPATPQTQAPPQSPHSPSPPPPPIVHALKGPGAFVNGSAKSWSSPAFLKRKVCSSTRCSNSVFDPFADEDDFREHSPSKRTKFGRKSAEWRFTERTPSPILPSDVQVEQQVDEQVEAESRRPSVAQVQEPPSPVSEQERTHDVQTRLSIEEGYQSPSLDHQLPHTALDLETHAESQDLPSPQKQDINESYKRSVETRADESHSVLREVWQNPEETTAQVGRFQTPVVELRAEQVQSSPAELNVDPTEPTTNSKDHPSMLRNIGELPADIVGIVEKAHSEKAMEGAVPEAIEEEGQESLSKEEEADVLEPRVDDNQIGSRYQTVYDYLRNSNSEQSNLPSRTLDDILRRSHQQSHFGSGPHDQKANRAVHAPVIELFSSSPLRDRTRSQPPSEDGNLDMDENQELDVGDGASGAQRSYPQFEDDELDIESDQQLNEDDGASEDENDHWALNSEDDSEEYPIDPQTESEGEYEHDSDNESARVDYVNGENVPSFMAHETTELSGAGDIEGEHGYDTVQSLEAHRHNKFPERNPYEQTPLETPDEGNESEANPIDDVDEELATASSDSDLMIIERPPGHFRHGSPGTSRASSFGYDGSAFSRPLAKETNSEDTSNVKATIGAMQGSDSTVIPVEASGEIEVAAAVDQPLSDRLSTDQSSRSDLQRLETSVHEKTGQHHTDRIGFQSPTSAARAASDQLREESMSPRPADERGPRHVQPHSIFQSPDEKTVLGRSKHDRDGEPDIDNLTTRARKEESLRDEDRMTDAGNKGYLVADQNTRQGDEATASVEMGSISDDENMLDSEPDDYWDEDDEVSEEERSLSELDMPAFAEDEDEAEMDDLADPYDGESYSEEDELDKPIPIKRAMVEIIDLESDDGEDTAVPEASEEMGPEDNDFARSGSSDATNAEATAMAEDDIEQSHNIQTQAQDPRDSLHNVALAKSPVAAGSKPGPSFGKPSKREIHDTYSQDPGFSEPELAENQSLLPEALDSLPSKTPAPGSPHQYTHVTELTLAALSMSQEETAEEAVKILEGPGRKQVEAESRAASEDRVLAPAVEATIPTSSVQTEAEIVETELTVQPSTMLQKEIPDSATEDQLSESPDEDEDDTNAAAAQLSDYPAPTVAHDSDYMDHGASAFRLDEDSSEDLTRDFSLQGLRDELEQRTQLPTPITTQLTKTRSEMSETSLKYEVEDDTLPTPSVTQDNLEIVASADTLESHETIEQADETPKAGGAEDGPAALSPMREMSDEAPPVTPGPSQKVTLVQKLKEMRSESAKKRRSSLLRETPSAASPWFGPRRSSRLAPESDREPAVVAEEETGGDGDVSSDAEGDSQSQTVPPFTRPMLVPPTLTKDLQRLPSSSPPPSLTQQMTGFRTNLSYFAPLNTIRSHYNATTSVLALVITSTPLERATTGPKDFHTTIYITDPSSSDPPSVASARIFRPSKLAFPSTQQGDAILLRSFRVVSYRKQLGLLSTDGSAWAVFRRGEEPRIRGPPVEFGAEERGFARGLWDWWSTVEKQDFIDVVPANRPASDLSPRKGRGGKGRTSLLRHELRDGTTYVDRRKGEEDDSVHELRDGTIWSDSK